MAFRMSIARLSPRPNQWHAVEEIVQEALAAASSGLLSLERADGAGFRAYLARIVEHKVADRLRRQARPGRWTGSLRSLQSSGGWATSAGPLAAMLSASGVTPRTAVGQAEQIETMLLHLGRLKDDYRRVLTYAFFDQLKTGEIAARMGLTRPAASMLLLRAVRALRASMEAGDEPHAEPQTDLHTEPGATRDPSPGGTS